MRATFLALVSAAFVNAAHAQVNSVPAPGNIPSLERWMQSYNIDADTVQAMRVCENNVAPATAPGAVVAYKSDFAVSCIAIRKKMYDAATAAASSKATSDKSLVDAAAKR